MRLPKVNRLDMILASLAVLFAIPSLGYPFGRDQALYAYIGREWLEGRVPYQSTFDVKTPGVYMVHALSIFLLGDQMWGIRIFELLCVIVLGMLCARVGTPRDEARAPGVNGLAIFTASIVYYGFFDFWNTGQCEIWCITFTMASTLFVLRIQNEDAVASVVVRAVWAGLLGGVAAVFKPPVIWFLALNAVLLLNAAWQTGSTAKAKITRASAALAAYGICGVLPMGAVLLHFRRYGALADLYDILVVNNRHYVIAGRWVHSWHDVLLRLCEQYSAYSPVFPVLLDGLLIVGLLAYRRRDRHGFRSALLVLTMMVCTVGAVTMQLKFCGYHWGLVVGPAAMGMVVLARQCSALASDARRVIVLSAVAVAILFAMSGDLSMRWGSEALNAALRLTGLESHGTYSKFFSPGPPLSYSWHKSEEVAAWIVSHSDPRDTISVRGFEPQVYLIARRRFPGRFFWTTFLVTSAWSYRMGDWLAEDHAVFEKTPPRYVLALDFVHEGPDSAEYFMPMGYEPVHAMHSFVILEKKR